MNSKIKKYQRLWSIYILISTLFFSNSSSGQNNINCSAFLDLEPNFVKNSNELTESLFNEDLEIIKFCGNLDSMDYFMLNKPVLGTLLVEFAVNKKQPTYRSFIEYINESKKTDEYKKTATLLQHSKKIENKKVDLKNWENDKEIFLLLGLSEAELNSFKTFISKSENSYLTYKQAFSNFYAQIKEKESIGEKELPENLFKNLTDYNLALNESKKEKKPLLLFFTGYACVNAMKMENQILSDNQIKSLINKNFIAYSAYVDDRSDLKETEQYTSKVTGKNIKTIGQKLLELQSEKFNNNSQPFFVIINNKEEILGQTGYINNKNEFIEFLNKGLK